MRQFYNFITEFEDSQSILIVYDKLNIDSILSAGLIKYIYTKTAYTETFDFESYDNLTEASIRNSTFTKILVLETLKLSSSIISSISTKFGANAMFMTTYSLGGTPKVGKSIYKIITDDTLFMNIYKLGFGIIEDVIPEYLKYVNASIEYTLPTYNHETNTTGQTFSTMFRTKYLPLYYYVLHYKPEDNDNESIVNNLYNEIIVGLLDVNNIYEFEMNISQAFNLVSSSISNVILSQMPNIKADKYKINKQNVENYLIFNNGDIDIENIVSNVTCDQLMNASRLSNTYWKITAISPTTSIVGAAYTTYYNQMTNINNNINAANEVISTYTNEHLFTSYNNISSYEYTYNEEDYNTAYSSLSTYMNELRDVRNSMSYLPTVNIPKYLETKYKAAVCERYSTFYVTNSQLAQIVENKTF